jgi:hypothetical protein
MHDKGEEIWQCLTIDNYDWREGSPLANAFIDQLLLWLIRAHPSQSGRERTELERLRDAKEAVFGIKPRDDVRVSRDFPMLTQMAKEYVSDRGGGRMVSGTIEWGQPTRTPPRGIKALADCVISKFRDQGREFNDIATDESVKSRLARKFKNDKDDLVLQVITGGGIEVAIMHEWHEKVQILFGPFLIPVAAPEDPVRDLKKLF